MAAVSTAHVRAMGSCSLTALGSRNRTAQMKPPSIAIDTTVSKGIGLGAIRHRSVIAGVPEKKGRMSHSAPGNQSKILQTLLLVPGVL